jgi:hypothetical protein
MKIERETAMINVFTSLFHPDPVGQGALKARK